MVAAFATTRLHKHRNHGTKPTPQNDKLRANPKPVAAVGVTDWALEDSNLGPMDYESTALTAELRALMLLKQKVINSASLCLDFHQAIPQNRDVPTSRHASASKLRA